MVQHGGLVDGSGVVIQPTGDGQVHGKVALRHAKGGQVLCDGPQFVQSSVKERVTAPIALQSGKDFSVTALDGDEFQDLIGLVLGEADVLPSEATFSPPILSSLSTVRMMSPDLSVNPSMA